MPEESPKEEMTNAAIQEAGQHLMEGTQAKIKSLDELVTEFETWWTGGGDRSRYFFFIKASKYATTPFPHDLAVLLEIQAKHSAILGWANGQLPDCKSFMQQALGIATEEAIKDPKMAGIKDGDRKRMVDSRTALFSKVWLAFDRLSATFTHRMTALTTVIATERSMWEHRVGSGAIPRSRY